MTTEGYLNNVFAGFVNDPPDSDFQKGYLSAMLEMYREVVRPEHYSSDYHNAMARMR
jgi:hypothetical protein